MRRHGRAEAWLFGLAGVVGCLALWEIASRLHVVNPVLVSSPSLLAGAAIREWHSGALQANLVYSLGEFVLAFGGACVLGLLAGAAMSVLPWLESALDPFVWFLYATPLIAFYPLFLLWFGVGRPTVVALGFLFAVVPVTINTLTGLRQADAGLVRAVRSFGATPRDVFVKVRIPAALPLTLTGLRLAVGRCLTGIVVGELFGGTAGLGFAIHYYGDQLDTNRMFAPLIVVLLLGVLLTQALSAIEERSQRWRG